MTAITVTTPSGALPPANAAGTFGTSAEDLAVRDARDLPDLIGKLQVVNPALAAQFVGKSLAASRTPWGTILLPVVAYLAARYGLGWSADIDALVAGVAVLVASYAMRAVTSVPITGWLHVRPVVVVTTARVELPPLPIPPAPAPQVVAPAP